MADEIEMGSWAEWRRLVLSEQRRIGHELREIAIDMRSLAKHADVENLERRVLDIEARLAAGRERNDDRRWLIGIGVLVLASIFLPSLRVLLFGGSGS